MVSRSLNDSWDITKSVGVTALNVASFRAAETGNDQPLIQDPFAQLFLDAVGDSSLRQFPGCSLPTELVEEYPELPAAIKARATISPVEQRCSMRHSYPRPMPACGRR
jgi:O-methyltransferase involved in polyketide biosynthesis